jgi:hypothetical protein
MQVRFTLHKPNDSLLRYNCHQQHLKLEPFMIMMVKYINANYDQTIPFILQTKYYKFVVATGFTELIPQCCRFNGVTMMVKFLFIFMRAKVET